MIEYNLFVDKYGSDTERVPFLLSACLSIVRRRSEVHYAFQTHDSIYDELVPVRVIRIDLQDYAKKNAFALLFIVCRLQCEQMNCSK